MISKYEQQKEAAFELAFELGLADYTDELESLMRPAIPLETEAAPDDEIPIGASKIGGSPDVPEGFEWPYWRNWPLSFVAQFRLEEFKAFDLEGVLPEKGLLALFCVIRPYGPIGAAQYHGYLGDERMRGGHRLFYFEDTDNLSRTPIPRPLERTTPLDNLDETLMEEASDEEVHQSRVYASYRVTATEPELQTPDLDDYPAVQIFGEREERDIDEVEELDQWFYEYNSKFRHSLLGYPAFIQGDHQAYAEAYTFGKPIEAVGEGVADWRILVQFTSDDNLHWGGDGEAYLWIRKQDLAARDFSRTYMAVRR